MNTRGDCFRLLLIAWSVLSLLDCHMSVWLLVVQHCSEDWWSSCCALKVSVKFGQSFDRIPHPDAALEESISEVMGSIYMLSLNCMSILCMLACIQVIQSSLRLLIFQIWNQRLQRNPSLYNGTKFRVCIFSSVLVCSLCCFTDGDAAI